MALNNQDKIYSVVTERIISEMEKGNAPWRKSWKCNGGDFPVNFVSKRRYSGGNVLMLLCSGFSSPYWLTFKQAKELGGSVKKDEKGTPVVYWGSFTKEGEEFKENKKRFLRYYTLFNTSQCEGLKKEEEKEEAVNSIDPESRAEELIKGYKDSPVISVGFSSAGYSPLLDTVKLPLVSQFESREEYYSTIFHELSHSTGHKSRLNREFGREDEEYSKEELIAEIGSAFLCCEAGISNETIKNSSAYCKNWLEKIKGDNHLILQAAAKAQLSTDYILGKEKQ